MLADVVLELEAVFVVLFGDVVVTECDDVWLVLEFFEMCNQGVVVGCEGADVGVI